METMNTDIAAHGASKPSDMGKVTDGISIERVSSVEPSENLTKLFTQVAGYDTVPDTGRINALISSGSLAFYLALDKSEPAGMVSVIACRTAASDKLWIEDVCVLDECRGKGLGKRLMEYAMEDSAKYFGGGTFWLTSRPSREAARAMYKALGFYEYKTGVFRKGK